MGGRANETFFVGVESLFVSWFRFAEIRARSETEVSLGSLLVLIERERPSVFDWEVALSEALLFPVFGFPATGTSVWMKQQRLPYGHEPDTQNVLQISVLYFGCLETFRNSSSPCANWHLVP